MVDRFEIGTMCCQEPDYFIGADSDGRMQGTRTVWGMTIDVKTEIDCELNRVQLAASCGQQHPTGSFSAVSPWVGTQRQ